MAVVHAGAVPVLVSLLTSPAAEVREQATWALGNVAGDCSQLRNMCLQACMIVPLLQILTDPSCSKSMMRNATWSVSNLFRGKPPPPFELVIQALPIVSQLIYSTDAELATNPKKIIRKETMWMLSNITAGSNRQIAQVIEKQLIPRAMELLQSGDWDVKKE